MLLSLPVRRQSQLLQLALQLAGKVSGPARLNAVTARRLVHIMDELSDKHFLVNKYLI
jgi:hypothetical protein